MNFEFSILFFDEVDLFYYPVRDNKKPKSENKNDAALGKFLIFSKNIMDYST